MSTTSAERSPEPQSTDDLLKLHLAEYQAFANRSTSLITQMFTVMAIGFGYLGYLINTWSPTSDANHRQVLWTGLLGEQIIILFWLALRLTELGITAYIDKNLRRLCTELVSASGFWGYRAFSQENAIPFRWLTLWLPTIASVGAFAGVLIYRLWYDTRAWTKWELLAVSTGVVLTTMALIGSRALARMNRWLDKK